MKQRKIPLRMCLGCQEMKPKKELLRIVKTSETMLEYDENGKKNGRGAYLCPKKDCLSKALKARKFQKSFGLELSPDLKGLLEEQMAERE